MTSNFFPPTWIKSEKTLMKCNKLEKQNVEVRITKLGNTRKLAPQQRMHSSCYNRRTLSLAFGCSNLRGIFARFTESTPQFREFLHLVFRFFSYFNFLRRSPKNWRKFLEVQAEDCAALVSSPANNTRRNVWFPFLKNYRFPTPSLHSLISYFFTAMQKRKNKDGTWRSSFGIWNARSRIERTVFASRGSTQSSEKNKTVLQNLLRRNCTQGLNDVFSNLRITKNNISDVRERGFLLTILLLGRVSRNPITALSTFIFCLFLFRIVLSTTCSVPGGESVFVEMIEWSC